MDDLLDDVYYQKRRNQEKTTRDLKTGTPIQEKAEGFKNDNKWMFQDNSYAATQTGGKWRETSLNRKKSKVSDKISKKKKIAISIFC